MSCIVLLEIQVTPESVSEMKELLKKMLPDTRSFAGCITLDIYGNLEDSGNLVFHESWDSRAHYERYLAWRGETGDAAQLDAMLAAPAQLRFFEQLDI